MTFDTTPLRSFIRPVWQEISSLWSGVDLEFSDPMPDPGAQLESASLMFRNCSGNVRLRAGARSSAG
jgi:hypothetical protein